MKAIFLAAIFLCLSVIDSFSTEPLSGKRIILDPGHGGVYSGAIGSSSLKEKDVNLKVALYLQEMLINKGADAVLTRATDTCFSQNLQQDLHARCCFSLSKPTDVFISLHHNAYSNIERNTIETYYKMGDPETSLDIASFIHRRLIQGLGWRENYLRSGNYHVLRNNTAPSVLCEPSCLSNPQQEEQLKDEVYLKKEAEVYLEALIEYFSLGQPQASNLSPFGTLTFPPERITCCLSDETSGLDPGSVWMSINEQRVEAVFDPISGLLSYTPKAPLHNNRYQIRIAARNLNGNSIKPTRFEFVVNTPADKIELETQPPLLPAGTGAVVALTAKVKDKLGRPVLDGTLVRFKADIGRLQAEERRTLNGQAITYLFNPGTGCSVWVQAGGVDAEYIFRPGLTDQRYIAGFIRDKTNLAPLSGAIVSHNRQTCYSNEDGFYLLNLHSQTDALNLRVSIPGYLPLRLPIKLPATWLQQDIELVPIYQGKLIKQRFVLDPEFGGEQPGAIGTLGTRASDVNLRVVRYLKDYLQSAGAEVYLTREDDSNCPLSERVKATFKFHADRLITIGHGSSTDSSADYTLAYRHYQNNNSGLLLAKQINHHLIEALKKKDRGVIPSTDYLLSQSSCPSVYISPCLITNPHAEMRLLQPAYNRQEAYAIFNGIISSYGTNSNTASLRGTITDTAGLALSNVLITLDDYLTWQTLEDGYFCFLYLPPGKHLLRLQKAGYELKEQEIEVNNGREGIGIQLKEATKVIVR